MRVGINRRMKAYLDNVIVSGMVRGDLDPVEMNAVQRLYQASKGANLEIATSRESWREQERTRDPAVRAALEQSRTGVPVVRDDHRLLGYHRQQDPYGGFVENPIVTDVIDKGLCADLEKAGLKEGDARHRMYAVCNGYDRFVTLDGDFITRRSQLEPLCRGLRIVKPSELVNELSL